jgi:hypothetical protein
MEDVLAVYTRPRDGDCPLVCLDETSKQLIAEITSTSAMAPRRHAYIAARSESAKGDTTPALKLVAGR